MARLDRLWQVICSEEFWLQRNLTWNDVEAMPNYPKPRDLYLAIPIAGVITILRFILERWVYRPIAQEVLAGSKGSTLEQKSCLEKASNQSSIGKDQLQNLSRELNWTVRQIEIWLRRRKKYTNSMKKFSEGAWRLTIYTCAVIYGFFVVKDLPWTDMAACYPKQISELVTPELMRWYYIAQLGLYISLTTSLLFDVRRKDFKIMAVHHFYSLALLLIAWVANATHSGALVICCHDVADVPLEAAKLCKYLKKEILTQVLFVVFVIIWFASRLGFYPTLIYGTAKYSTTHFSPILYYIVVALLSGLLVLHLMWSWMILKIIRLIIINKESRDVRSDNEASDEDDKTK